MLGPALVEQLGVVAAGRKHPPQGYPSYFFGVVVSLDCVVVVAVSFGALLQSLI
jgi:hypothetical protein